MNREQWVKIDLELLRRHLSTGRIYSAAEVERWLTAHGFSACGDGGWLVTTETDLGLLDPSEILDGRPAAPADVVAAARIRHLLGSAGAAREDELDVPEARNLANGPTAEAGRSPPAAAGNRLVPAMLWGRHRDVVARCRPFVRRAVKAGSWEAAAAGAELVSLDERPGVLIWKGPSPLVGGDSMLLYPVLDLLVDACREPDQLRWYRKQRRMILGGLDRFWFCLGTLADTEWLIVCDESDDQKPAVAAAALPKLMRWWPDFCDLAPRFEWSVDLPVGWPLWGRKILSMCRSLGVPMVELEKTLNMSPPAVGDRIHRWIEEWAPQGAAAVGRDRVYAQTC